MTALNGASLRDWDAEDAKTAYWADLEGLPEADVEREGGLL